MTHSLHKRLAFHIANGASNLCDNNVIVAGLAKQKHPALDFVSYMWHYLDRFSKIGAFPLTRYDGVVYPSSSDVIGLGRMNSKETLIVAKVKVGLGPVLRHITLPVLIGIEGAGVYIEIRVKFLDCYAQSPCLK